MTLVFRALTPADRAAVDDICATIWDGRDYLPGEFAGWVAAPAGQAWFRGAEVDGRLAVIGRLARLAAGEYWLEGMRVHPEFRRRGLAAALHQHLLDLWEQAGEPGTLRLATHCRNDVMLALCARTGFQRIGEYTFAAADADAGAHAFAPLTIEDAGWAFAQMTRTTAHAELGGLCDLGWKWQTLTPTFLAERLAAGEGWRWRGGQGVLLAAVEADDDAADETHLQIRFPAVDAAERDAFLRATRALAHALGCALARWMPPARADLLNALSQSGFRRTGDDTVVCLERRRHH